MPENIYSLNFYSPSRRSQDLSEIPADSTSSTNPFLDSESAFNASILLLGFMTLTLVAWGLKHFKKTGVQERVSSQLASMQSSQKIPCHNCRYFNSNPYLKCAVNPSTVLSDKAIECAEYKPDDPDQC